MGWDGRGQGEAQALDLESAGGLGSGLEVVRGPQTFRKGRKAEWTHWEGPGPQVVLVNSMATDQKLHYPQVTLEMAKAYTAKAPESTTTPQEKLCSLPRSVTWSCTRQGSLRE